jgi:2'-5' RNA ligase
MEERLAPGLVNDRRAQGTLRLFLAVNLPEAVRASLAGVTAPLRSGSEDVRWTASQSLHLTLVFLGERPAPQVEVIAERVGQACAAHAPFTARVAGLGCFPSPARPRILWAGLEASGGALLTLQRTVQDALVREGLAAAEERFVPHLTLGRVRESLGPAPRADLGRRWLARTLPPLPPVPVVAVQLMRSELGRGGARYTVLRSLDLAG